MYPSKIALSTRLPPALTAVGGDRIYVGERLTGTNRAFAGNYRRADRVGRLSVRHPGTPTSYGWTASDERPDARTGGWRTRHVVRAATSVPRRPGLDPGPVRPTIRGPRAGAAPVRSAAGCVTIDVVADRVIEVPAVVRRRAADLGAVGGRWLAGLGGLVADLEREWSITVGPALDGGSASYVARARTATGRDAVLKLALPDPAFADQVGTVARAHGRGYVHLLAHDIQRHAMLQEALGPSLADLDLPPEHAIGVLCRTLRRAWQPVPPPGGTLTPREEKARGLGDLVAGLWEALGQPCPEPVVARALWFAEQRAAAFDPGRCVVVHGDPHPANTLRVAAARPGAESGFVFVDPDGFLADPTYDLGVVLRDWCPELLAAPDAAALARHYCHLLADTTGLDATAIWQWGFLERVSTGLFLLSLDAEQLGRPFLDTAGRLL